MLKRILKSLREKDNDDILTHERIENAIRVVENNGLKAHRYYGLPPIKNNKELRDAFITLDAARYLVSDRKLDKSFLGVGQNHLSNEEIVIQRKDYQEVLAAGEFIHNLGNLIFDEAITIGRLTKKDGELIQDLGHLLRVSRDSFHHCSSRLYEHGFDPIEHERIVIIYIAQIFIGSAGDVSFSDAVKAGIKHHNKTQEY